jgi:F-type H+-transporting ATPase subunit alpha
VERQIVIIYAGTNGFLDDIEVAEVPPFETGMYRYLEANHRDVLSDIAGKQALDDDLKARIGKALGAYKEQFKAQRVVLK